MTPKVTHAATKKQSMHRPRKAPNNDNTVQPRTATAMTTEAKLERIKHNDPNLIDLDLWLSGDTDIKVLTDAIQRNKTIISANILFTCQADEQTTPTASTEPCPLASLFETIGSIPTLRKICITGPTSHHNAFPVKALATLLRCASESKRLSFGRLIAEGTEESFHELAESIGSHASLEEIYLNGSILVGGSLRIESSQNKLMDALANLSTLKTLTLNGTGISHRVRSSTACLSLHSLASLSQANNLSKLLLYDFFLDDDHIQQLESHLLHNNQLREIRLSSCILGSSGLISLASILQGSSSSLRVLHLWIKDLIWDSNSTTSWLTLAHALQDSKLVDFRLLTGVRLQVTLRAAPAFSNGAVPLAFSQAIQKNYYLQDFSMPCNQDYQTTIAFHLRLNKMGRRKLFGRSGKQSWCAKKEEWVEVLSESRNDLDCLYYFLSMNPTIC